MPGAAGALIFALVLGACDSGTTPEPTENPVGAYTMVRANEAPLPSTIEGFTMIWSEFFVNTDRTYRVVMQMSGTIPDKMIGGALGTYTMDDGLVRFRANLPGPDGSRREFTGRLNDGILRLSFASGVRFEYEPCVLVGDSCQN